MSNNNNNHRFVYDIAISLRLGLNAHTMSNIGSFKNILLPRRVLLENGIETDAISGAILKHFHAESMAFRLAASDDYLCPACQNHDPLRAANWVNSPEHSHDEEELTLQKLLMCGLCDTHGFMIPKFEGKGNKSHKWCKNSIINYSMALAIPESFAEISQLHTRQTINYQDGMIFEQPSRSGMYGLCIRYTSGWIGVDTGGWQLLIEDADIRKYRHSIILETLRNQFLSIRGSHMANMMPHLTKLEGAITVQLTPGGSAPMWSPLDNNYLQTLESFASKHLEVHTFTNAPDFFSIMADLIENTTPNARAFDGRV